jgi:hypothetical protein
MRGGFVWLSAHASAHPSASDWLVGECADFSWEIQQNATSDICQT